MMMKCVFMIAAITVSSAVFADSIQPQRVTCSITLSYGSNPETGDGGTSIDNVMILQAAGPSQYDLYYVLGHEEYRLAKDLRCTFVKDDRSLYSCSKPTAHVNDCIRFEVGNFSRKIVINRHCSEPISARVRETTFIQTDTPSHSGGCFVE